MNIIISNSSGKPFYEQIAAQIRSLIFSGELAEGEALPSMRALAKDLRISLITTKRAYEDLERAGYIETVPGKGCFVAQKNMEVIREEQLRLCEEKLRQAAQAAKSCGIPLQELTEILGIYYAGE